MKRVEVSDEAHRLWRSIADRHGVSLTGLLEELGFFIESRDVWMERSGAENWDSIVERTRDRDAARRRRGSVPSEGKQAT